MDLCFILSLESSEAFFRISLLGLYYLAFSTSAFDWLLQWAVESRRTIRAIHTTRADLSGDRPYVLALGALLPMWLAYFALRPLVLVLSIVLAVILVAVAFVPNKLAGERLPMLFLRHPYECAPVRVWLLAGALGVIRRGGVFWDHRAPSGLPPCIAAGCDNWACPWLLAVPWQPSVCIPTEAIGVTIFSPSVRQSWPSGLALQR